MNSNFEVTSDSLLLQQLPLIDVLPVYKGEKLVVAEFMVQAADTVDSVWVKVARDQETMGWVREGELLKKVVPVCQTPRTYRIWSPWRAQALSTTMIMYLNNHLFSKNYGMAGAVSVVLFLVCAVLCVVVYFSLTKEDDGLTKAQRKELKAAKKAAAKGGK